MSHELDGVPTVTVLNAIDADRVPISGIAGDTSASEGGFSEHKE